MDTAFGGEGETRTASGAQVAYDARVRESPVRVPKYGMGFFMAKGAGTQLYYS